jgi:hypothetical protein
MKRDTQAQAGELPSPTELIDGVCELYEQRHAIGEQLRAGRGERFVEAFEELFAMHITDSVTLDELAAREQDYTPGDSANHRRLTNRIHQRHKRAREDMLLWVWRQEKIAPGREPMPRAKADRMRWAIGTILCARQSAVRLQQILLNG